MIYVISVGYGCIHIFSVETDLDQVPQLALLCWHGKHSSLYTDRQSDKAPNDHTHICTMASFAMEDLLHDNFFPGPALQEMLGVPLVGCKPGHPEVEHLEAEAL